MPLSGSGDRQYFYPGVHTPNSSYPSTDLRGVNPVPSVAGLGRLYVLSSSGDLRYVDPSGNDILVASQTSEGVFNSVYISSSLLVKGDTVLSGNVVVGGQLYDLNSNLILSSSVGSIIAASGSLDFPNTDKNYHIRAVNSRLVLSSSAGSAVYISGNLQASGSHTLTGTLNLFDGLDSRGVGSYHLRAVNSHLILSSSAGSTVTLSAALDLLEPVSTIKNYSIRSTLTDLILSSSATSVISISSSLRMISQTKLNYHIAGSNDLILSATVGNITISGAMDTENNGKSYDLRNKNSHLILTSSVGSIVRISGALGTLDTTTAALPANAVIFSGAIVWDSTRKALKVYGPEGWTVLATGTVG